MTFVNKTLNQIIDTYCSTLNLTFFCVDAGKDRLGECLYRSKQKREGSFIGDWWRHEYGSLTRG